MHFESVTNGLASIKRILAGLLFLGASLAACNPSGPVAPIDRSSSLTLSAGGIGPNVIPGDTDLDEDGLGDTEEETLIRRYRPYFYFDGQEFIFPISINDWANIGGRNYLDLYNYYAYASLSGLYTAASYAPWGTMSPNYTTGGYRENYGPLYVDAVPMPESYSIGGRDSLIHLHFWLFFSTDIKYSNSQVQHEGDWEHVCVLAERKAVTDASLSPVKVHWHHHGGVTVSSTAYAYHTDGWGTKHPRAYVETGSHGIYRAPGTGGGGGPADDDAGSPVDPLTRDFRFMTTHWTNRTGGTPGLEKDILQTFDGHWGGRGFAWPSSDPGPLNPLEYVDNCGHDYDPNPVSFRQSNCVKYPLWDDAH